ncbi:hypothetical protein ACN27G_34845 [Plantactinospora sp. WMMB334]|uniref:hypothetical protein n=1 Tax=Plantactinospora sp. WMMB334 TaxID=3404119 RepID=UPI003B94EF13
MTELHSITDCHTCGTPNATHWSGNCATCEFWAHQFATPGGLIIGGCHYRISEEPTAEQLAEYPKLCGSNGARFTIRLNDGTEVITHNLWGQGNIPPGLTRPDNAEFVGDPEPAPRPRPATHDCLDHLDYIGGSYPYECLYRHCGRRYDQADITRAPGGS